MTLRSIRWRKFAVVAFCPACREWSSPLKVICWRTTLGDHQRMFASEAEDLLRRHPLTPLQLEALDDFAEQHRQTTEMFKGNDYGHPGEVEIELHVMPYAVKPGARIAPMPSLGRVSR